MPATLINKSQNVIVRSSNRFRIVIGDQEIGLLQDLRCQDDYSPEPASGIGSITVREYVPTMARHTISTSQACMFINSLRQMGISFDNGADAMKGLVFDIQIIDRTDQASLDESGAVGVGDTKALTFNSNKILRVYKKCSFASGDIEIRKHAMIVTSATINACDVSSSRNDNSAGKSLI